MKTRFLFPLLILVLLCVLLPRIAPTASAEELYSGSCGAEGDNLLWSYDPDTTTLTITGSGDMADYQDISQQPWASYRQSVTALSLPEGLTRIGNIAFASFQALTEVQIPDSVTELGQYSFFYTGLTAASIPAGISEVPQGAFAWCFNLSELTLSDGLTVIGPSAFEGCHLRNLRIPETVTTIGDSAFRECTGLKLIQVPASVTAIEDGAFYNIYDLVCLSILNENCELTGEIVMSTDHLVIWGHMDSTVSTYAASNDIPFGATESLISGSCGTGLTWSLDPENGLLTVTGTGAMDTWNSSSTPAPWNAFLGQIRTVVLEEGVTTVGAYAFYNCTALETVSLPQSLTTINSYAFRYCGALTALTIPEGVTSLGGNGIFQQCTSLTAVNIPSGVTAIGDNCFEGCSSLTGITIPSCVTVLGYSAFRGCISITRVTIPPHLTYFGSYAFSGCTQLSAVTIPDGVTTIAGCCFENCSSLTQISFPASLTEIAGLAFAGTGLTRVTIPATLTALGQGAFARCSGLAAFQVEAGNPNYQAIDGILFSSDAATLVQYPAGLAAGVYEVPACVNTLSAYSFSDCAGLTDLTLPAGLLVFGRYAFQNCTGLTALTVPDGINVIPDGAFYQCSNLQTLTLPDRIQSVGKEAFYACSSLVLTELPAMLSTVGDDAFYLCASLTRLVLPQYLKSIGRYSFFRCSMLEEITFPQGMQTIGTGSFGGCFSLNKVVVLSGSCTFSGNVQITRAVIYGLPDSTAQTYAAEKNLTFVPIDLCDYDVHDFVQVAFQPQTDTEDGFRVFQCTRCSLERTEVLPAWNACTPLEDGLCYELPQDLLRFVGTGGSVQYASADSQSLYFREEDALYSYSLRSGGLSLAHSFPQGSLYYCSGERLYSLYDGTLTVFDLGSCTVTGTLSLPQMYQVTAFGVDGSGRIYAAGKAASNSAESIYLYSQTGVLLSEVSLASQGSVYCFVGFDADTGYFFMETRCVLISYVGSGLTYGQVTDDTITLLPSKTEIALPSGEYYYPKALDFCYAINRYRSAELCAGQYLVSVSSFSSMRRVTLLEDLTQYRTLPYLPNDSDVQSSALPSIGARSVYLERRGSILAYDGNRVLTEYDTPDFYAVASRQTAHPVFSLNLLGDRVAAVELENGVYYLELFDWGGPSELTVSATELTMTVGQEILLSAESDSPFPERLVWSSSSPEALSVSRDGLVSAWKAGTFQVTVSDRGGNCSRTVIVHVLDRSLASVGTESVPETLSSNQGANSYSDYSVKISGYCGFSAYYNTSNFYHAINSVLYKNADGTLERLRAGSGDAVLVSTHASDGTELSRITIPYELTRFGGYFRSEDGRRYLVFCGFNPEDSDDVEVFRIVQYSADWTRLGACSVFGANTYSPVTAGSLRMVEVGGKLYIHTCHQMYEGSDGVHHQSNMTLVVDETTMTLFEGLPDCYTSHSFNQFIVADGTTLYRLDQGDGYPRALSFDACSTEIFDADHHKRFGTFPFCGGFGENITGASIGGLAVSADFVLAVGTSVDQSDADAFDHTSQPNVFLVKVEKDFSSHEILWLTDYQAKERFLPGTPFLAKLGDNQFLLLWEEYLVEEDEIAVAAMTISGDGTPTSQLCRLRNMRLSDCEPVLCADGSVCWCVNTGTELTFFRIDPFHLLHWPGGVTTNYPFADVSDPSAYYFKPVYWAYNHEPRITSGVAAAEFGPDRSCTREQFMVFLWKLHGAPAPENASPFLDVKPSAYYADAVCWAAEQGITGGVSADRFGTGGVCTRAQAVTFLWRSAGSPEPETASNPFRDVSASSYYYKAVLWAAENQIAVGISESSFGPNLVCTRAQAVTMLYGLALLSE